MSEQSNVQVVQEIFAAFGRGDLPTILAHLTNDVDWLAIGPAQLPHAGSYQGVDEVPKFFTALAQSWDYEQFEPQEFVAQDDTVVVIGRDYARAKSTGIAFENPWVIVFTFQENKVARLRIFEDTATLVAALQHNTTS